MLFRLESLICGYLVGIFFKYKNLAWCMKNHIESKQRDASVLAL